MININSILPQLAQDKANHAIYGALLSLVGAAFLPGILGIPALVAAIGTGIFVGVAKEMVDKYTGGDVSPNDALATSLGGVIVGLATLL